MYSVAEAVDVFSFLVCQNDKDDEHSFQFYLDVIKQKMINDVQVPVQQSQLNILLLAAIEEKTLQTCWNQRGVPKLMSLSKL